MTYAPTRSITGLRRQRAVGYGGVMVSTPTTRDGTWDPLIDKRTGKPKRVSKHLQEAVTLIESGAVSKIKAACERVGLSYNYVVTALQAPHVQAFIARKK